MTASKAGNRVLFLNTLAFAVCFAVWTLYGVLVTFLVDKGVLHLDKGQIGWLIGVPVLTGSIMRLPIGILTDRYGGKPIYLLVMAFSAVAVFLTSFAQDFAGFLLGGLAFGLCGASFAVGVAYTALWFPKERQGTALGIFGMGNIGTAFTALGAPHLLTAFTHDGVNLEGWRMLPRFYGVVLLAMVLVFAILAPAKRLDVDKRKSWSQMLRPLRQTRVWRFGLYYFLLFGGFVALSQWLIPYYLNVYGMTLATAGLMATLFSLPSALTRAVGGFVSDRLGARTVLYVVLSGVAILCVLLTMPRMDITSPGEGVLADRPGVVTAVGPASITVGGSQYAYKTQAPVDPKSLDSRNIILPQFDSWQEPIVKVGDHVGKKQVLAAGKTHIYFQANQWVFTGLLFGAGILMGFGMAAVYKHIPEYFPQDVGVVGGLVGVLGGLGGFILPIVFGALLKSSGIWTTCWLLLAAIALVSVIWMHLVVLRIGRTLDVGGAAASPAEPAPSLVGVSR